MILNTVADYLKRRGEAPLADIARHVDADESAVRGMLAYWARKGKVMRADQPFACGSRCGKCASATGEIYLWREAGSASLPVMSGSVQANS